MGFSVLMSVYQKEKPEYLREALQSVIHQSMVPQEIVLMQDGRLTDGLYQVIDETKREYPGFKTFEIAENGGLGRALAKGVGFCENELIARMDTDDIAIPKRCEMQLIFMNENPHVSIVGGQIEEFIDDEKSIVGKREVPLTDSEIKCYAKRRCPFNHMTVMFRKQDIIDVGNYQDWFWNEDYYLWIRLVQAEKKLANLPETLVKVRVGAELYQRRGGKRYFDSEKKIQKYMLDNHLIGYPRYFMNVLMRLVLQVLMPNWLRGCVFRTFARK